MKKCERARPYFMTALVSDLKASFVSTPKLPYKLCIPPMLGQWFALGGSGQLKNLLSFLISIQDA